MFINLHCCVSIGLYLLLYIIGYVVMGFSQYEAESFHSNAIFQQSMAWCCGEAPLSPTAEHHTVDILLYLVVLLNRGLLNPTLHPPSSASAAISFSVYTFAVYCSFSIVLSVSFMYRSLGYQSSVSVSSCVIVSAFLSPNPISFCPLPLSSTNRVGSMMDDCGLFTQNAIASGDDLYGCQ